LGKKKKKEKEKEDADRIHIEKSLQKSIIKRTPLPFTFTPIPAHGFSLASTNPHYHQDGGWNHQSHLFFLFFLSKKASAF
jgi:hypothetical protein